MVDTFRRRGRGPLRAIDQVRESARQLRSVRDARGRPSEPELAGLHDRAFLMTGFVGALRRSELVVLPGGTKNRTAAPR